jgi:uncharacterized protein
MKFKYIFASASAAPGRHLLRLTAAAFAAALLWTILPSASAQQDQRPGPIRALIITGGCCHDYPNQIRILSEGISARARVQFDHVLQGGTSTDIKINAFKTPLWADGYDVIVHNECFGNVRDADFVNSIAKVHEEGLPAVVIHCAMHSFRHAETDEWRKFLGVTSVRHERHRPVEVKNLQPDHPIMKGFPSSWKTPNGELYEIEKIWPNTTPLAQAYGVDTRKDHICIWTNNYGQARVFGTTLGHHNETMQHEVYLDFITRGLLWAVNKLEDNGEPAEGYGR